MSKKYLLDANILIEAKRQRYPFDIVPSFWKQLKEKAKSTGQIIIIQAIYNEIKEGNDELTDWLEENKDDFIVLSEPVEEVQIAYSIMIQILKDNKAYFEDAKNVFADAADSWLCAYGPKYGYTVVTNERYNKDSKKTIYIPNVCKEFKIECINMLDFMREMKFLL
ncbi:MAG: DUF4411 family protein [Candidatus Cloacimonadales bacterium]